MSDSTILLSKSGTEGITIGELLGVLEKVEGAPTVLIETGENSGRVLAAFKCWDKECGALHTEAGPAYEQDFSGVDEIFHVLGNKALPIFSMCGVRSEICSGVYLVLKGTVFAASVYARKSLPNSVSFAFGNVSSKVFWAALRAALNFSLPSTPEDLM